MRKVGIDQLADAVMDELQKYNQEVTDGLKEEIREAGDFCCKAIKQKARKKTGAYSKSWRVKEVYESLTDLRIVVHSVKEYRLAHLLEKGHAIVGKDGRVLGTAPAFPHIAPAEQETEKLLMKKVKVLIKGSD